MKGCFKIGVSALICLMVMVAGTAAALAASYNDVEYNIILDNKKLEFDQFPVNVDGRILVPMRTIFEAYGAEIEWNQDKLSVTAITDEKKIVLTVDEKVAYINKKKKTMDTPAMLINGRTMVPLRFVSEVFDAEVEWDPYSSSVIITSAQKESAKTASVVESTKSTAASENKTTASVSGTVSENSSKSETSAITSYSNIKNSVGFFSTQQGIKGACYLTCLGMISSNLNNEEIYASDVYAFNEYSVNQHNYFGLLSKLNIIRTDSVSLSGKKSDEKISIVLNLLKKNPEGVIIRFLNNRSHYIVCKGYEDGKLIVNDPVGQIYVPLDECWTGYSMCNGYDNAIECLAIVEAFDKGTGSVKWE